MSRHKQVTVCRKSDGPVSKECSCEHCQLAVCGVCEGAEGTLTTDCPGVKVDYDRHQEVFETNLDYTDDRGWHLSDERKSPRFESAEASPESAPSLEMLQRDLTQKAVAWVLADRVCEQRSAVLTRVEDETLHLRDRKRLTEKDAALLAKLEREQIDFRMADRHVQKCDDEVRQAMRKLAEALEA